MKRASQVWIGLVAVAIACSSSEASKAPDIYVRAGEVEYQNGGTATFMQTAGGTGSGEMQVLIGNAGDAPLTVTSITVKEGGNAYMAIQPPFAASDFPHVIAANDLQGATAIKFKVKYTPGSTYDDRPIEIVIESDDFDEGVFTLRVAPQAKAARIKVIPDNITFVDATAAHPGIQCFEVQNIGTEVLELTEALSFESATTEFQIIDCGDMEMEGFQRCRKGAKVDPPDTGGSNLPCKFAVRYKPQDTPDTNYVLITSNDPIEQVKRVKVEGLSEPGDLQVTRPDPTCLDFTAQQSQGDTCSKVVKLYNAGAGSVLVDRPILKPATLTAYSVKWYKVAADSVASGCTYTPGTGAEIPEGQTQYRLDRNASLDVVVTYTSPGGLGENGTLVINYHQPFAGSAEVQLCGGAEKGQIEISPPAGTQLVFHANPGEKKTKTIVLMNTGNGPLTVHYVKVPEGGSDVEGAFAVEPPVNETSIPAFSLLPVTVEFRTDVGEEFVIANGQVEISYADPLTGQDQFPAVNVTGHRGDFEGVTLPVAVPKAIPSGGEEAPKAGVPFTLDGSESQPGTHPIWEMGYRWFVTQKPSGSQVFLNLPAGPSQATVTPDVAGRYQFRLVVFSAEGSNFYFSDEGVLDVDVVP